MVVFMTEDIKVFGGAAGPTDCAAQAF